MIYVMSDIHGCFNEFKKMLKLIKFSPKDELYILGDIIDRGTSPIETLLYIKKQKNIHVLLGNHEYMMMDYFKEKEYDENSTYCKDAKHLWIRNGGKITLEQFLEKDKKTQEELLAYINNFPYYFIRHVNGKEYLMVHAGAYPYQEDDIKTFLKQQTLEDIIWIRDDFLYSSVKHPFTIIFGHTPIASFQNMLRTFDNIGKQHNSENLIEKLEDYKIAYFNNKIAIDGGCVFGYYLTCICLDTGKEYFVMNEETEKSLKEPLEA